jgi:hypothetical protein
MTMSSNQQKQTAILVQEAKIHTLLAEHDADDRLEASGVCVCEGVFYVVFDNAPHIARLSSALAPGDPINALLRQPGKRIDFEDITTQQRLGRFLIIIEALRDDSGRYRPKIVEYNAEWHILEENWVDFQVGESNKGLEGIATIHRHGQDYVLGLCEGNWCAGGKKGRTPGGGRIQVLEKSDGQWNRVGTINLPPSIPFKDYASIDVCDNQVIVVSQVSSALWVGTFQASGWDFVDQGRVYDLPRNDRGKKIYCNVEGVAWIAPNRVVAVSDRYKPGEQKKRCRARDQSIHIFAIPGTR